MWGGDPDVLSPSDRSNIRARLKRFCECDATDITVNVRPRVSRTDRDGVSVPAIHAVCTRCERVHLIPVADLGLSPRDFEP